MGAGGSAAEPDAPDHPFLAGLLIVLGLLGAGLALAHRQHLSHSSRPGDACPVTANGGLIGFDARTGEVRWTNVVPEATGLRLTEAGAVHALSATALPSPDRWVVADRTVDAATGAVTACSQRRATLTAPEYNELIGLDDPLEPPLRLGGTTVAHWADGIRATDASGTGIWSRRAARAEVRQGDDLLVATSDRDGFGTARIDLRTGDERWSADERYLGLGAEGSIVVTADRTRPTAITGRDAKDGTVRWKAELPWPTSTREPHGAMNLGPLIAVPAGEEGRLVVIDSASGRTRWVAEGGSPGRNWKHTEGGDVGSAVLSADGEVVIASVTAWVPDSYD